MKKIAVIVGHTEKSQGAISPFKDKLPSEWRFNSEIAEGLRSPEVDIYYYDPSIIGYKYRVDKLAEEINSKDYEVVIELHYNASGNPQANGTEALYYFNSKEGKRISDLFCEMFSAMFKTKNRYAKGLYNKKQRGFYFLESIKAPAIILEPIFGTSEKDINLFIESKDSYKEFLQYFINNYILT